MNRDNCADGCLELAFGSWGLKKSVETECGVDMGREYEQLFFGTMLFYHRTFVLSRIIFVQVFDL